MQKAGVDVIVMTLPRWGGGAAEPRGGDDGMMIKIAPFSLYRHISTRHVVTRAV